MKGFESGCTVQTPGSVSADAHDSVGIQDSSRRGQRSIVTQRTADSDIPLPSSTDHWKYPIYTNILDTLQLDDLEKDILTEVANLEDCVDASLTASTMSAPCSITQIPEDVASNQETYDYRSNHIFDVNMRKWNSKGSPKRAKYGHAQWRKNVDQLVLWRQQHPNRWPSARAICAQEKTLFKWLVNQRFYKKKMEQGSPKKEHKGMTPERVHILHQLLPGWDEKRSFSWQENVQKLIFWRIKYPDRWPSQASSEYDERRLGTWLNHQRSGRNKLVSDGYNGPMKALRGMNPSRAQTLDTLFVDWHDACRKSIN